MIIFKDVFSNDDELLSDSYVIKEVDGVAFEVDCAMVDEDTSVNVDIGANPSAEEAEEALDEGGKTKVINMVRDFRLQQTSFDKKSYMVYLKGYMKNLTSKLKEQGKSDAEIADFQKKANDFAKKILGKFGDWEFYMGYSMNPDGMVLLLNYREDGVTPYFVLWKDGLEAHKY
ncbi:hypothetical protein VTK56DRAFT_7673 [Thermocarpiscus australiensis]